MGIIAPAWYFAPQRPVVAEAGWRTAAFANGINGRGPIAGLDEPPKATMLLQFAGELADAETKRRVWEAAEAHIEPTWDTERGEFTLGFGLNEAHPRGQYNARAMAGWVCTKGAWSRIFNEPNLAKFDEPTVVDVDFPNVALSEARWDGAGLHLAAQPRNDTLRGTETTMRVVGLDPARTWVLRRADGSSTDLSGGDGYLTVTVTADNQRASIETT